MSTQINSLGKDELFAHGLVNKVGLIGSGSQSIVAGEQSVFEQFETYGWYSGIVETHEHKC